jgi:hypothetical protein
LLLFKLPVPAAFDFVLFTATPMLSIASVRYSYDIANNQITTAASLGQVGLDWQVGGFAVDPPTASMGSSGSTSQLVQAMAGFGGGSGVTDGSNTVPLGAETSQQLLLTTPQHV